MTQEQTWTYPERPTTPGPWQDEPDKIQWIDPATDLDCLISRGPTGALCGYVGVPPGHPWHGVDYNKPDVEVHGGLTYANACDEDGHICHIPAPGRPKDVWWLGFDCAHFGDLCPRYLELPNWPPDKGPPQTYKDVAYVRAEVTELARQVADAFKMNEWLTRSSGAPPTTFIPTPVSRSRSWPLAWWQSEAPSAQTSSCTSLGNGGTNSWTASPAVSSTRPRQRVVKIPGYEPWH